MGKIEWLILSLMTVIIIFLFVRGHFVDKEMFREHANGILVDKKKGSRMSYIIYLYISETNTTNKHIYGYDERFETLKAGDSIVKIPNSYFLTVFIKKDSVYYFSDSF